MNNDIEQYSKWLEANGKSKNTIKNYISRLRSAFKQINSEEITEEALIDYIIYAKKNLENSTINKHRGALNLYLKYKKQKIIVLDKLPEIKKFPKYITLKDFEEKVIPLIDRFIDKPIQAVAVLYFMFYTGLRKEEIIALQRKNFNFTKNSATIILNKQKKEKVVYYPDKVKDFCNNFFMVEVECKNAFNLSDKKIRTLFDKLKPGFTEVNLHPHLLRHSFATYLRSIGWTIDQIQKAMGHTNHASTEIYAHIEELDIKELYEKTINKKEGG